VACLSQILAVIIPIESREVSGTLRAIKIRKSESNGCLMHTHSNQRTLNSCRKEVKGICVRRVQVVPLLHLRFITERHFDGPTVISNVDKSTQVSTAAHTLDGPYPIERSYFC